MDTLHLDNRFADPRARAALLAGACQAQVDPALQALLLRTLAETLARARLPEFALAELRESAPVPPYVRPVTLSAREREILVCIDAGNSNKAIARRLDLSVHTVKRHVANILGKLDARSRGEAAAIWRAQR